jgi:hypothetical protein
MGQGRQESLSNTSSYQISLVPMKTHQNPFVQGVIVPINFLLFSTQPYINSFKALTFAIKSFFCNLETWLLRWFHGDKYEKNVIKKKKEIEKHGACMMCSEKMAVEDGRKVCFLIFWVSKFWKILTRREKN